MTNKVSLYIVLAGCLLGAACSGKEEPYNPVDGEETAVDTGSPFITLNFTGDRGSLDWEATASSRGGAPLQPVMPESVGVFGYNNRANMGLSYSGAGEVFHNRQMFYSGGHLYDSIQHSLNPIEWDIQANQWPYYNPEPWLSSRPGQPTRYKFFAYAPFDAELGDLTVTERSFDGWKSLTWQHIPKFSAEDYMIAHNISTYKSKEAGDGLNLVQEIQMMHLLSRIRFNFVLGPEFGELRRIRLKELRITSLHGQAATLRIDFTASDTDAEGNTTYTPSFLWTKEETPLPFEERVLHTEPEVGDYLELSAENADYQPFASLYIYPYDDLPAVNIAVKYDVVDLKGQLLRKDDRASNNIPLGLRQYGSTGPGGPVLQPGYYHDVYIRIEPSYLYVLSDNDFAADGYLIMPID